MPRQENASWLDVGTGKDGALMIRDHGAFARVIGELTEPDRQYPVMSLFLGGARKNEALRSLFSRNNIKRSRSDTDVGLRCDLASIGSAMPILFADSDPLRASSPACGPVDHKGTVHPITWSVSSAKQVLSFIYARLLFLFTDIVCIFVEDFQDTHQVTSLLTTCLNAHSASSLPCQIRPGVIIVLTEVGMNVGNRQFQQWLRRIDTACLSESFSAVRTIDLTASDLSWEARWKRLRVLIMTQLDEVQRVRRQHQAAFTASHMESFFQLAVRHLATTVERPFDFVLATRKGDDIGPDLAQHLAHYQTIGCEAGIQYEDLAPSIASALLMNHYRPRRPPMEPRTVYRTLYQLAVLQGIKRFTGKGQLTILEVPVNLVEEHFVDQFVYMQNIEMTSVELRRRLLMSQSGRFCILKSNLTCLYCLARTTQHPMACGHSLCDVCAQDFGVSVTSIEYRFTVKCCHCLSTVPCVIDVLPPTMDPTVIAIDGGGIRGVIPLEFLVLVQEHLGPECRLQDIVDLAIGTSAGGLSVLTIFHLQLDILTCSQLFDQQARRIFHKRLGSALSWLPPQIFGGARKCLAWWLNDGCYDAAVFDSVLQETYTRDRYMFQAIDLAPSEPTVSRTKVGVIAATIAKETKSVIFGNFNGAALSSNDFGYKLIRPRDAKHEPRVWEAARATAAAPFLFPPVNIAGLGSFQDGGLQDNFAGGIANRVIRQIWPSRRVPARMLSLGTGRVTKAEGDSFPQFRHIFSDGFLPRAYHAWMSSMDTDAKWSEMKSQLDESIVGNYTRLDVPLQGFQNAIDDVDAMDSCRNLVILQPGSGKLAKEATVELLVSRFFFVLDSVPDSTISPFWCHGTIRCKAQIRRVLPVLERLLLQPLDYVTDTGPLGHLLGQRDICPSCERYCRPVSFQVRHVDEVINVYLRAGRQRRWKINGFPSTVTAHIAKQGLSLPFGGPDHGHRGTKPCDACDVGGMPFRGHRRKRDPLSQEDKARKRVCIVKNTDS